MINEIVLGDSIESLSKMEDNSIDMVLTSPPYDDLRYYGKNKDTHSWNEEVFKKIAQGLTRVLKPGGVIVWVVGDATIKGSETGTSFKQALYFKEECGLNIHDTMIYKKKSFSFPSKNKYHQVFEYMFVFSKGRPKTFNPIEDRMNKYVGIKQWGKNTKRGKDGILKGKDERRVVSKKLQGIRFNVWQYGAGGNISTSDKIAFEHPAIFPEDLALDQILSWTNENDIVLDPFCGSGTTVKLSKLLKRRYIGLEINEEYIHIIKERLKIADSIINNKDKYQKYLDKLYPPEKTVVECIKSLEEEKKKIDEVINRLNNLI